jgi:hypothetical protein
MNQELDNLGEIENYQNSILDINMDTYYEALKDFTFETKFLPFSINDAKAFMAAYDFLKEHKTLDGLAVEVKTTLSALEAGVQRVIDEVRGKDDCVFVKTSCRSAKDTAIFAQKFRDVYRELLSKKNPHSENDQVASLIEAAVLLLQTHNAKELVDTFVLSERVYEDLNIALGKSERWDQYFVVRKWYTIHPSMEFRGFVCNGALNALSQYNHLCYYPNVTKNEKGIGAAIVEYFNVNIKDRLAKKFPQYVVDFAIVGDREENGKFVFDRIFVIELNPFLFSTDGALFSWGRERNLLEHGPFEFRVLDKEITAVKTKLSHDWRDVLEQENRKLGVKV